MTDELDEAEVTRPVSPEMKRMAEQRARDRAKAARWDLDVAVFFFAVLTIVIILLFQEVGLEVVAPAAACGLAMGWLMGWKKAKQLYERFHEEELSILEMMQEQKLAERVEEEVQKALLKRFR